MILFFDTETTGKAHFHLSSDDPHQPRIVQLAALLTDDEGEELGSLNVIIKPDGFVIPDEAAGIHGITTEKATACGVSEQAALHVFDNLLAQSTTCVAHNFQFDCLVISRGSEIRPQELSRRAFCTMLAMTPICKLPGNLDYKWPRLQEAYRHCFEREFVGAHDALADVRACRDVYFWLKKQPATIPAI